MPFIQRAEAGLAPGPHHLLEMDKASEEFDRPRPMSRTDAGIVSRGVIIVPEGYCITEMLDWISQGMMRLYAAEVGGLIRRADEARRACWAHGAALRTITLENFMTFAALVAISSHMLLRSAYAWENKVLFAEERLRLSRT